MQDWQFVVLIILMLLQCGICMILFIRSKKQNTKLSPDSVSEITNNVAIGIENSLDIRMEQLANEIANDMVRIQSSMNESMGIRMDMLNRMMSDRHFALNENLSLRQDASDKHTSEMLAGIRRVVENQTSQSEERYKSFEASCLAQLKLISSTMDVNIRSMKESNDKHLDEIRVIVDEKLQRTLNERITESFKLVNERLAEVYKGLGEMQTLASGVGDLKKVLSNVKTRGTLGEIQLGAILDEILAPEQFERNFDAGKGNLERVEFAIKLPNNGDEAVYLPIDSKFPADIYAQLNAAYDSADPVQIAHAKKNLRDTLLKCAKEIRDKYINPPKTTDFAIMFLPTEGLYAEAVRLGTIEAMQRSYKVNLAGPSTMAALLNSLQMGFRTLAIQKRSSEVWEILAKIKKEFITFDTILTSTRNSLEKANNELEKLIGVRTRQILRTLKNVEELPATDANSGLADCIGNEYVL